MSPGVHRLGVALLLHFAATARLFSSPNSVLHPRLFIHAYMGHAASADPMSRGTSLLACL